MGGGGSSGSVSYPAYMETMHENLLYEAWRQRNITVAGGNPYSGMAFWAPRYMIDELFATVDFFDYVLLDYDPESLWDALRVKLPERISSFSESSAVTAFVDARKQRIRTTLEQDILPAYRRGVQELDLGNTSAYKIGEAKLWSAYQTEVTAVEADITGKVFINEIDWQHKSVELIMQQLLQELLLTKDLASFNMEVARVAYVANKEYRDSNNRNRIDTLLWNLESLKYVNDTLGSVASSMASSASVKGASTAASAIGGALGGAASGAAMGSMIAPGAGTAIGAAAGGVLGLLGGFLG